MCLSLESSRFGVLGWFFGFGSHFGLQRLALKGWVKLRGHRVFPPQKLPRSRQLSPAPQRKVSKGSRLTKAPAAPEAAQHLMLRPTPSRTKTSGPLMNQNVDPYPCVFFSGSPFWSGFYKGRPKEHRNTSWGALSKKTRPQPPRFYMN